jgi:hypothetical protein
MPVDIGNPGMSQQRNWQFNRHIRFDQFRAQITRHEVDMERYRRQHYEGPQTAYGNL